MCRTRLSRTIDSCKVELERAENTCCKAGHPRWWMGARRDHLWVFLSPWHRIFLGYSLTPYRYEPSVLVGCLISYDVAIQKASAEINFMCPISVFSIAVRCWFYFVSFVCNIHGNKSLVLPTCYEHANLGFPWRRRREHIWIYNEHGVDSSWAIGSNERELLIFYDHYRPDNLSLGHYILLINTFVKY